MAKKTKSSKISKLSAVDQDILTVMNCGREFYGLELLHILNCDRSTLVGCELSYGSIYPALNRLIDKKLITWRWGDESEDSNGARRKYYQMTQLGKERLNALKQYRNNLLNNITLNLASA